MFKDQIIILQDGYEVHVSRDHAGRVGLVVPTGGVAMKPTDARRVAKAIQMAAIGDGFAGGPDLDDCDELEPGEGPDAVLGS